LSCSPTLHPFPLNFMEYPLLIVCAASLQAREPATTTPGPPLPSYFTLLTFSLPPFIHGTLLKLLCVYTSLLYYRRTIGLRLFCPPPLPHPVFSAMRLLPFFGYILAVLNRCWRLQNCGFVPILIRTFPPYPATLGRTLELFLRNPLLPINRGPLPAAFPEWRVISYQALTHFFHPANPFPRQFFLPKLSLQFLQELIAANQPIPPSFSGLAFPP